MSSQAHWACIILHGSLLGTKKKNRALLQFFGGFDPSLIQGLSNTYQVLLGFPWFLLGILWGPHQAKLDFCRLRKLFFRTLSKAYQGLIGLYPILEIFSPMSSQAHWACIILHGSLLGTKKKIGPSCNFLGVLTPVASKANQTPIRSFWDSIQPWTFFSKSLPKLIGTMRLFHEALWASYETLTKPSWIFVDSWNFFSNPVQSLSKPHRIVSNPGIFFPNVFPSLLRLYHFTWEPLRDHKKK